MAGTWRIAIDSIEGLGRGSLLEAAKNAFYALNKRESAGFDEAEHDATPKQVIIEVSNSVEASNVQRTKPFDVPDSGTVRVNRVLFVPAPAEGSCVVVRILRHKRGDPYHLVGEAGIDDPAGEMQVEMLKRGKSRCVLHLKVSSGLQTPAASAAKPPTPSSSQHAPRPALPPSAASESEQVQVVRSRSACASGGIVHSRSAMSLAGDAAPSEKSSDVEEAPSRDGSEQETLAGCPHKPPAFSFQPVVCSSAMAPSTASGSEGRVQVGCPRSAWASDGIVHSRSAMSLAVDAVPSEKSSDVEVGPPRNGSRQRPLIKLALPGSPRKVPALGRQPVVGSSASVASPRSPSKALDGAGFSMAAALNRVVDGIRGGLPGAHVGPRQLRMRPPHLPSIGTCDIVISNIEGLSSLQRPYFIVGLEGQEFRAEDVLHPRGDGLRYQFAVGSVLSNLQIHVFQDTPGPHFAAGRILLPLADVLWSVVEPPTVGRLKSSVESRDVPYSRRYVGAKFLLPSATGEGSTDFSFSESFGTESLHSPPKAHLGSVVIQIEVTLRKEVQPLLALYATSMLASAQRVHQQFGQPETSPTASPLSGAGDAFPSADLSRAQQALQRARHRSEASSNGIGRLLQEQQLNGYIAAGIWFTFCGAGFFPCSLWALPFYTWIALLGNGLLAASQRSKDWRRRESGLAQFADDVDGRSSNGGHGRSPVNAGVASPVSSKHERVEAELRKFLGEAERFFAAAAGFAEKLRNLLTFADVAASAAFFAVLGLLAAALTFSLLLATLFDPSHRFICGLYGAAGLLAYSRAAPKGSGSSSGSSSESWKRAFNEVFACVPDDAQMLHRFVATRIQCEEV
mmetsp:Transcript_56858/g.184202  ORF Transcript_56858/g.184202 Transcript_56858/m.184202 type:complete len:851 (+) Transcript_56858:48-2600(+)